LETLAFYSYTGGFGRSGLLASAGRSLAARGQRVVALDLDLTAPGLHYELGCELLESVGVVPYLLATVQGALSPPPMQEHVIGVPVGQDSEGWLRLMPAGPAPERAYWVALKQLGEQIRFDDPSGQGLMSLLDLQARIEEELKPDYCLIDVGPGVTELGGLATTILADTVVSLFVGGKKSLGGTVAVLTGLKAAPRLKEQAPVRVVPVHDGEVSSQELSFWYSRSKEWQDLLALEAPGESQPKLLSLSELDRASSMIALFHSLFPSVFPSAEDSEDAQGALSA